MHNILVKNYRRTKCDKKILFHFYHSHFHYVIQTLTRLDLSNNQIGAQGVQYLSNALQKNKVREKKDILSQLFQFFTVQTLTTLDLSNNQIGDKGVQYLSEGLQKNKVRQKNRFGCRDHISLPLFYTEAHYTFPG